MKFLTFLDMVLLQYKLIPWGWLVYNQWIIRTIAFLHTFFHSYMPLLHIMEIPFTFYLKKWLQSTISLSIMRIMSSFLEVVTTNFLKKTTLKLSKELQKPEKPKPLKILNHPFHRTTFRTQKNDRLIYNLNKSMDATLIQTSFIIWFVE